MDITEFFLFFLSLILAFGPSLAAETVTLYDVYQQFIVPSDPEGLSIAPVGVDTDGATTWAFARLAPVTYTTNGVAEVTSVVVAFGTVVEDASVELLSIQPTVFVDAVTTTTVQGLLLSCTVGPGNMGGCAAENVYYVGGNYFYNIQNTLAYLTLTIGADVAPNPTAPGAKAPSASSSASRSSGASANASTTTVVGAGTTVFGSGAHSSNSSTATFIDVGTASSGSTSRSSSSNAAIHPVSDSKSNIIGGVVASVAVFIIAFGLAVFLLYRRHRRHAKQRGRAPEVFPIGTSQPSFDTYEMKRRPPTDPVVTRRYPPSTPSLYATNLTHSARNSTSEYDLFSNQSSSHILTDDSNIMSQVEALRAQLDRLEAHQRLMEPPNVPPPEYS